jgi:uncharacterized protein (DUF1697 family)
LPVTVGLLRGVNVGGRSLPMAELRELVQSLGFEDVRTYIQSGNLLFSSKKRPAPAVLEAAIERRFGLQVDVMLRSPEQLEQVVERNPFPDADRSRLHVGFMTTKPSAEVSAVDAEAFLPEQFAIVGTELYLHLPNGMGRTKLPDFVLRRVKVPTTIRNWRTVTKLAGLARET